MPAKVAVLLPTRNRIAWLKTALECFRRQTYRDFVIRVSDDGSSDGTKDLTAEDFPDLPIIWKRRDPGTGGLAEHLKVLLPEIEEELYVLAHDDEVYSSNYLETLVQLMENPEVTLGMGRFLFADLRSQPVRLSLYTPQLGDGLWTAAELKREIVINGVGAAPGSGFIARTSANPSPSSFPTGYLYYDFQFMMALAEKGRTAGSSKILHTYCTHLTNTMASSNFLREASQRITPYKMYMEWLEQDVTVTAEDKATAKNREAHPDHESEVLWGLFRASLSIDDIQPSKDLLRNYSRSFKVSRGKVLLGNLLLQPVLRPLIAPVMRAIRKFARSHFNRPSKHPAMSYEEARRECDARKSGACCRKVDLEGREQFLRCCLRLWRNPRMLLFSV